MTREQAVAEEVRRMGDKSWPGHDKASVVRVHVRTLVRLHGLAPYDDAHLTDDTAGDAMFGDDHTRQLIDLPLAA